MSKFDPEVHDPATTEFVAWCFIVGAVLLVLASCGVFS